MKVKLTHDWNGYTAGHTFPDMPGGQARTLIANKLAVEVKAGQKAMEAPLNRAIGARGNNNRRVIK